MFLALFFDNLTQNYDTQRSQNHHLSLSTQKPRGLSRNGGRWNGEFYIKIKPANALVTPPDSRSGYKQG